MRVTNGQLVPDSATVWTKVTVYGNRKLGDFSIFSAGLLFQIKSIKCIPKKKRWTQNDIVHKFLQDTKKKTLPVGLLQFPFVLDEPPTKLSNQAQ